MAQDIPARVWIDRLNRRLAAVESLMSSIFPRISGAGRFQICEDYAEASGGNWGSYDLLVVCADADNEDAGIFRRVNSTSQPLNGRDAFQDAVGTIFERVRNV